VSLPIRRSRPQMLIRFDPHRLALATGRAALRSLASMSAVHAIRLEFSSRGSRTWRTFAQPGRHEGGDLVQGSGPYRSGGDIGLRLTDPMSIFRHSSAHFIRPACSHGVQEPKMRIRDERLPRHSRDGGCRGTLIRKPLPCREGSSACARCARTFPQNMRRNRRGALDRPARDIVDELPWMASD
jgi:hypothetical protein